MSYTISTDKSLLDVAFIHNYLSNQSYWAKGRTIEDVRTTIDNSFCFGVYEDGKQVGFARVVTDYAVFAYVADVFIDENHRGKGLSKQLMKEMLEHPLLCDMKQRWLLATLDAHGLYNQFGFNSLTEPQRFMEMKPKAK